MKSSGAYDALSEEDSGNQETEYILNGVTPFDSNIFRVYMGEDIRSIRSMLKRYTYNYAHIELETGNSNDFNNVTDIFCNAFPLGPSTGGYGTSGYLSGLGSTIDVHMTYLRYYCQAYVGYRGGIKWKIILSQGQTVGYISAYRLPISDTTKSNSAYRNGINTSDNTAAKQNILSVTGANSWASECGIHFQDNRSTTTCAFEIPYYFSTRYTELHSTIADTDDSLELPYQSFGVQYSFGPSTAATGSAPPLETAFALNYVAGGEDFTFFFFIGQPPMTVRRDL
jgi:hypothetical protein